MRIGLFGGTFDPVHLGHLILAERCREEARLDEVWFLPSYRPPHKVESKLTRFEHRCEMLQLAIVGQPAFRVEPIEKELPPPSYTANTLHELQLRHPEYEFVLILGMDSLVDLPQWYEPKAIIKQAELLIVSRPGAEVWDRVKLANAVNVPDTAVRLQTVNEVMIDIASRDLRQRVAEGKSIRFLVPRSIEELIRERRLYRE